MAVVSQYLLCKQYAGPGRRLWASFYGERGSLKIALHDNKAWYIHEPYIGSVGPFKTLLAAVLSRGRQISNPFPAVLL